MAWFLFFNKHVRYKKNIKLVLNEIEQNSNNLKKNIRLVAVSKGQNYLKIKEAFDAGQKYFGENYLQEALEKKELLEDLDIEWHFIGPIQSNKCKAIAENFSWVQTVDRIKIANRLNQYRSSSNPLNVCLQINISNEPTKSGMHIDEVENLLKL